MKRQGEVCWRLQQGEAKEPGQGEDDMDENDTIETRICEVIPMSWRDDYNKDRRSDIYEEYRQG